MFGGALVVLADLIGRWAIAPSELPVGIVTAMIGAPYFVYLLWRSRNR
jgi:iron complex transport system permease protein